jgi:hypothetical protein
LPTIRRVGCELSGKHFWYGLRRHAFCVTGVVDRGVLPMRPLLQLQQRVLLDLGVDEIGQLKVRELQHLDRLLQPRSHNQSLRLAQFEPLRKTCHVHIPLSSTAALIAAKCPLRTCPSANAVASIAVSSLSHATLPCMLAQVLHENLPFALWAPKTRLKCGSRNTHC